jgi:hypothetical protein
MLAQVSNDDGKELVFSSVPLRRPRAGPTLRDYAKARAARGANLDSGHGKHGAMAAAPSDECPTADALDAARRASDAKGPMRGDEWNGTLERDHTVAEQRVRRPFRRTA